MLIKEYGIRYTDDLDVPKRFLIGGKYFDGDLSLVKLEIITKSHEKYCNLFNPQCYENDSV